VKPASKSCVSCHFQAVRIEPEFNETGPDRVYSG
jgi:hypothetical protein